MGFADTFINNGMFLFVCWCFYAAFDITPTLEGFFVSSILLVVIGLGLKVLS